MDVLILLKALILGIVEGLTEFLPVSSTGHMILAGALLDFNDDRGKAFEVAIQFAAILAVCWLFRERITKTLTGLVKREPKALALTRNLIVAFLPAAILGVLFASAIKAHLFAPLPVALAFILGALAIFWVEKNPRPARVDSVEDLTVWDAFRIGCCQALALIPGTSRSGATILGGMFFGVSRPAATEFSFFLAIPTLFGATVHEVVKYHSLFARADWALFLVGGVSSFFVALLTVRGLIRYVSRHTFVPFAWYRIGFGVMVLATGMLGWISWGDQ